MFVALHWDPIDKGSLPQDRTARRCEQTFRDFSAGFASFAFKRRVLHRLT